MTETELFFEKLAHYYWHENDLSNVTVALCNSSKCFKEKFLHFFFEGIDISNVTDITREVCDPNGAGSRVDIHISTKTGELYIIEVKIYDLNHHPEYSINYEVDREHFGYITNYNCIKDFAAIFRTWGDFYDNLTKQYDELDDLSKAFMSYLKIVCNITRYTNPMNFSNINSICQFLDIVNQLIETNPNLHPDVKLVAYNKTTDVQKSPLVIARRYGICNKSGDWLLNGYAYVGIEQATIGFSTNGDLSVMNALSGVMSANSRCWGFPAIALTPDKMNQLNTSTLKEQEDLLKNSLKEFIDKTVMVLKEFGMI